MKPAVDPHVLTSDGLKLTIWFQWMSGLLKEPCPLVYEVNHSRPGELCDHRCSDVGPFDQKKSNRLHTTGLEVVMMNSAASYQEVCPLTLQAL